MGVYWVGAHTTLRNMHTRAPVAYTAGAAPTGPTEEAAAVVMATGLAEAEGEADSWATTGLACATGAAAASLAATSLTGELAEQAAVAGQAIDASRQSHSSASAKVASVLLLHRGTFIRIPVKAPPSRASRKAPHA